MARVTLFWTTLALGLAGFDPLGFAALIAAMGLGASRRAVGWLLASSLVVGTALGVGFSLGLGEALNWVLRRWFPGGVHLPASTERLVEGVALIAAGLGLAVWAAVRVARRGRPKAEKPKKLRSVTVPVMLTTGVGVGASVLIDPAFYAMAVVAGREPNPVAKVLSFAFWTLLSQIALVVGATAVFLGAFDRLRRLLTDLGRRYGRAGSIAATALLFALAAAAVGYGVWLLLG